MFNENKIKENILNNDGSFRDITFTPTNELGLINLLKFLFTYFKLNEASNIEGKSIIDKIVEYKVFEVSEYCHTTWTSIDYQVKEIQLFIDFDPYLESFACELSFHPADISSLTFNFELFLSQIELLASDSDIEDYFIRYENLNWELYDRNDLGVFADRKTVQILLEKYMKK